MLDLCFSDDPHADIIALGQSMDQADVVCVTVRNIDTVLYPDTEYFLPAIARIIEQARESFMAPIIIGGAGLRINPEGILHTLRADYAIVGPAENTLVELINLVPALPKTRIFYGPKKPSPYPVPIRGKYIDYAQYIDNGGIAALQTHKGCSSDCTYCIEAKTRVMLRDPQSIVEELRMLCDINANHFHLADSEFNENTDHCLSVLDAIIHSGLKVKWTLYMRVAACPDGFFSKLKQSGAYHITLSVDTLKRPDEYMTHAVAIITRAKSEGIRISVDLLGGFPDQGTDILRQAVLKLIEGGADEVVVNTVLRLGRCIPITEEIISSPKHSKNIIGHIDNSLEPCFYIGISQDQAREALKDIKEVSIAGDARGVNYERA